MSNEKKMTIISLSISLSHTHPCLSIRNDEKHIWLNTGVKVSSTLINEMYFIYWNLVM